MRFQISLFAILYCLGYSCEPNKAINKKITYHNSKALMEVEELLVLHSFDHYTLIDFRPPKSYQKGHLPKAINIWRTDIENDTYPYGGMMPSKLQLELLLSNKGIKTSDTLIIYDDRGSCDAARLWWVLNYYGFHQVKLLNGGLRSYLLENKTLSTLTPKVEPSNFVMEKSTDPKNHIGLEALKTLIDGESRHTILDCRSKNEHTGLRHKKGARKAGRIPKSVSMDWTHSIDLDKTHRFLSADTLFALYEEVHSDKNTPVVTFCHSGVRSAHTTFVLTQLLGYKNVSNYDGSWMEWSHHDLPFEKDVETQIFD